MRLYMYWSPRGSKKGSKPQSLGAGGRRTPLAPARAGHPGTDVQGGQRGEGCWQTPSTTHRMYVMTPTDHISTSGPYGQPWRISGAESRIWGQNRAWLLAVPAPSSVQPQAGRSFLGSPPSPAYKAPETLLRKTAVQELNQRLMDNAIC